LAVYRAQTMPLIAFYAAWSATGDARAPKLRRISGIGSVEEIRDRAFAALA
jgi:adenylate kinase